MGLVALAFVAGLLTALSPCVLPVLPLVVGSASRSRLGPAALAAGFVAMFTVIGVALATVGAALGLNENTVRLASAALLIVAGVLLLSHRLQDAASQWLSPLASASAKLSNRVDHGLGAQFAIGALLGGVWSPCVGPTLGAALGLATRSETLAHATVDHGRIRVGIRDTAARGGICVTRDARPAPAAVAGGRGRTACLRHPACDHGRGGRIRARQVD